MISSGLKQLRKLLMLIVTVSLFFTGTPVRAGGFASETRENQRVDTDPFSLINEVNLLRAANGLPAYSINPILMLTAQQHAQYMSAAGVSHTGAGGTTPYQRGLAAGYPLAGNLTLGGFFSENITAGVNKSVQDAVKEWQGDSPHLTTMLSPNLQEIGAGVVIVGDYVYYVIDCAQPTSSGKSQIYTPAPGVTSSAGATTGTSGPVVVRTIIPNTPEVDGKVYHIVKPGETLWLIAISYGVKIVDIRRLNNLAEAQSIFPTDKLLIKQVDPPTRLPNTPTATLKPTLTATPLPTINPSPMPTLVPEAPVSSNSSMLILGLIVVAAFVLAAVFMRAGRKVE